MKTQLKHNYKKYESPEERLRNKLQPFYYLVDLALNSKDEDVREAAQLCEKNLDPVKDLLDDIEPFYTNPFRINPVLDYKDLPKLDYNNSETRMYSLHSRDLVFVTSVKEPVIFRAIEGNRGICRLTDIGYGGRWSYQPTLEVFFYRYSEHKVSEETYEWDNHRYIQSLSEALIKGITNQETEELDAFAENHGVSTEELRSEIIELYQDSLIYNFW